MTGLASAEAMLAGLNNLTPYYLLLQVFINISLDVDSGQGLNEPFLMRKCLLRYPKRAIETQEKNIQGGVCNLHSSVVIMKVLGISKPRWSVCLAGLNICPRDCWDKGRELAESDLDWFKLLDGNLQMSLFWFETYDQLLQTSPWPSAKPSNATKMQTNHIETHKHRVLNKTLIV